MFLNGCYTEFVSKEYLGFRITIIRDLDDSNTDVSVYIVRKAIIGDLTVIMTFRIAVIRDLDDCNIYDLYWS